MKTLRFDAEHYPLAGAWAQERIGTPFPFRDFTALTLIESPRIVATVLYCNWNGANVEMHVASDGTRQWMTRSYLRVVFAYPFEQLQVRRVSGVVAESNVDAVNFDFALGFKLEGRMRQAATDGSDLLILGMLRSECRFLSGGRNGKRIITSGRARSVHDGSGADGVERGSDPTTVELQPTESDQPRRLADLRGGTRRPDHADQQTVP